MPGPRRVLSVDETAGFDVGDSGVIRLGGTLVGDWYPAGGADEIIAEQVHAGSGIDPTVEGCEEMWCLDSDNIPTSDAMSPMQAAAWGELYERVDEHQWQPFCA